MRSNNATGRITAEGGSLGMTARRSDAPAAVAATQTMPVEVEAGVMGSVSLGKTSSPRRLSICGG